MADTKQTRAIAVAESLRALALQQRAIDTALQELLTEYNNENYSPMWSAMATAALNADGSIGAADASPTAGHPITVGGINRTAAQLVAMMTYATDLHNFLNNVQPAAALRIQTLNDLVG